jgi:transcriptional regulator with XRE-family HTH domain
MLQPSQPQPAEGGETGDPRTQRGQAVAREVELDPSWRAGRKLEEARRQRGLSIQEVSDRIRVRPEFLEALEAMNVKVLPGKAYALAFLRSYAKTLGLDENAIAEQFQDECALTREDAKKQIRDPRSRPHPERPWLAAAALLVFALGFVAWRTMAPQAPNAPPSVTRSAAVRAPAQTGVAAAPVEAQRLIEIRVLQPAWLEARGPDGTVFLSRTMAEGEIYRPDPSPGWTLHARDGSSFELFVDGASAGLLGPSGAPVLGRPIDEIEPSMSASLGR